MITGPYQAWAGPVKDILPGPAAVHRHGRFVRKKQAEYEPALNPLRATATIHRRQKPLRKVPRRRSIVADLLCEKCQATIRRRRLLS
ncbi:hypothetical protein J6590_080164 [Homalodisca vitripennis]|nr:hypothetical protein J6590_080164 [Homalodisca vitripennis]